MHYLKLTKCFAMKHLTLEEFDAYIAEKVRIYKEEAAKLKNKKKEEQK